jgi:hypothetical protein
LTEENRHDSTQPPEQNEHSIDQEIRCPQCGCSKIFKDGIRRTNYGDVQRYICRYCAYRFTASSKTKPAYNIPSIVLNSPVTIRSTRQICANAKEAKNLAEVIPREAAQREGTPDQATTKGLLVQFEWKLSREGFRLSSIQTYVKRLKLLAKLGANLEDEDSVKDAIAKQQQWDENTKLITALAYASYLKTMKRIKWTLPRYQPQDKIPYLPSEEDINTMIAQAKNSQDSYYS